MKNLEYIYYDPNDRKMWESLRRMVSSPDGYQTRYGGSDISTVLGLNQYKSKARFFYECCGEAKRAVVDNDYADSGHILEPIIMKEFWQYYDPNNPSPEQLRFNRREKIVVRKAKAVNATILNQKYPQLFYNPDGLILKTDSDGNGVWEGKSAGREAVDSWDAGIYPGYILQVQSGMLVMKKKFAEIALLINGRHFQCFRFEANPVIQDHILDRTADFQKKVLAVTELKVNGAPSDEIQQALYENEPAVDDTETYESFLKERFRPENVKSLKGDEEMIRQVQSWLLVKSEIKKMQSQTLEITNYLRKKMVDHEANEIDFGENMKISWKKNGFRIGKKLEQYIFELNNK